MDTSIRRTTIRKPILAQFYTGQWEHLPVFENLTPFRTGHFSSLATAVRQEGYDALRVTLTIEVGVRGMCGLTLSSAGESQLLIDGRVVTVNHGLPPAGCTVRDALTLDAGRHEAVLIYLRNAHPARLRFTLSPPAALSLDRLHWLNLGLEGDWPKSWTFMSGALAPGRRRPPITYTLRVDGREWAPDETSPDRRKTIEWTLDEGVLPSPVSAWRAGPVSVRIQHLAAAVGEREQTTAVFTRVRLHHRGRKPRTVTLCVGANPRQAIPLTRTPDRIRSGAMEFDVELAPGATAGVDMATRAAGRFTTALLRRMSGFDTQHERFRARCAERASGLACPVELPDPEMAAMYRALQFSTQTATVRMANGDWELRASANSPGTIVQYDRTFSHDVPNMIEQMIIEGDFDAARRVLDSHYYQQLGQTLEQDYLDAIPKYLLPYATYLIHTGDLAYFTRDRRVAMRRNARLIESFREGQRTAAARKNGYYGLMNPSGTLDNGRTYLLVDNLAALHGLSAYRYLAGRLGDRKEADWAQCALTDLNTCLNDALTAGMHRRQAPWYHNLINEDAHPLLEQPANWLMSGFMMAAFPWGAWLKGFDLGGAWRDALDTSIRKALDISRSHGCADGNWGAFWQCKFGTVYNAALGLNLLYSPAFRTLPIANLRWLLDHPSAPFQWGENFWPPRVPGDWTAPNQDYESWGLCFSRQALQQSCMAVHADGRVFLARGVPDAWLRPGRRIAWTRAPATGGRRMGFSLRAEARCLILDLDGDPPEGDLHLQPPLLVNNIAAIEADAPAQGDEKTGTVCVAATCRRLVVKLRNPNRPS